MEDFNPGPLPADSPAMQAKRWQIGNVRVTRIVEGGEAVDASFFLEGVTREFVRSQDWLRPYFVTADGQTIGVRQTFVVESEGKRILVDTCVGNDKPRTVGLFNRLQTSFLQDLEASGCAPEAVDLVLCTHLHVDHVGWNTRLVKGRWVPTFPNARYLFGRKEWEYWTHAAETYSDGVIMDASILSDSITPVIEEGLADLVDTDHVITSEVRLIPTPGHTPGHVSVEIVSAGRTAIITGDMMHHPVQCCMPDVTVKLDDDTARARATRRAFLARYGDAPVVVFGTHFAHPTAGWIRARGDAWIFDVGGTVESTAPLELSADGSAWHVAK